MTERVVPIVAEGRVTLHAVDGADTREVGWLEVGDVAESFAVSIAAAFADLRLMATSRWPVVRTPKPEAVQPALTVKPARGRPVTDVRPGGNADRVLTFLASHPNGATAWQIREGTGLSPKAVNNVLGYQSRRRPPRIRLTPRGWVPLNATEGASTPVRDGPETFHDVEGVRMGRTGLRLLETIRAHPEGITGRDLWSEAGIGNRVGHGTSLTHLHRNGLVRKEGDRASTVWYPALTTNGDSHHGPSAEAGDDDYAYRTGGHTDD